MLHYVSPIMQNIFFFSYLFCFFTQLLKWQKIYSISLYKMMVYIWKTSVTFCSCWRIWLCTTFHELWRRSPAPRPHKPTTNKQSSPIIKKKIFFYFVHCPNQYKPKIMEDFRIIFPFSFRLDWFHMIYLFLFYFASIAKEDSQIGVFLVVKPLMTGDPTP